MLSRRFLLRLMIGCLAVTALIGVIAVFVGGGDFMARLAGTAFAGAITALLMLRSSVLMERPERRRAGYFTMWLALLQFALAFGAIWADRLDQAFQIELGRHLWGLLAVVVVTGWPAANFVGWMDFPPMRVASRVALIIDAIVFLILFFAVWTESYLFHGSDDVWEYAAVFSGLGLVACASLVGYQPGDRQWWRWIGVAASGLAAAIFCYGIYAKLGGSPKIPVTFLIIGLAFAHQNLMFLVPLKAKQNIIRNLTVGLAVFTFAASDYLLWEEVTDATLLMKFTVATGILAVCGTLTMLVLAKLNRVPKIEIVKGTEQAEADAALPKKVSLACPVCAKALTADIGDSACDGCGLLLTLKIATPRCAACGYSLLHNKAPTCPECGANLRVE
jgi:hypothetical protein